MVKYTAEERKRAVELLIKYDLSIHAVICELGTEQDEDYNWTDQDIYEQLRKLLKNKTN